MNIVRCF